MMEIEPQTKPAPEITRQIVALKNCIEAFEFCAKWNQFETSLTEIFVITNNFFE